jgi:enoyl-CoA hydratase/carnithine racemase
MRYQAITYKKSGRAGYITLNRPQTGNELTAQMSQEIADVCNATNQDAELNVVILSGAGDNFCSGCDPQEPDAGHEASQAIASIEKVTIAAIDGNAFGEGLELALACDIRIATERARFCFPQISNGVIPSAGGTQRLPRLVGQGKALELILTSEPIDAREALSTGIIAKIVPPDRLQQEIDTWATKLSDYAPIALRYAKEAVNKGLDLTLDQGLHLEADLYFLIQTTEDRMEGIRAFLEKRAPEFKGE